VGHEMEICILLFDHRVWLGNGRLLPYMDSIMGALDLQRLMGVFGVDIFMITGSRMNA
jgi:hypothetical protein